MSDIIQLLPDHVANQIAAGEVVQRPASVVKELLENAVDAGATTINLLIKDAGKTLIQVSDNGCGMSLTDARMCFERHATSKIKLAEDLFALQTKGFRGEALASIAAIAHVDLKSKPQEEEIGAIKYFFRQNNSDEAGRPKQWGIEISSDGQQWTRVFTSKDNLSTSNAAEEQSLAFDKNYKAKFFRLMILKNGGKSYTHLGEMNVYRMRSSIIDKEKEAEDNY